eukprot:gene10351-11459_t
MTTTPSSSSSSSSSSTSTQLLEDILSKAQAGDIDGLVQAGMKVSLADSTAPVSANSLLEAKLKDTEITRAIVKEKGVDEKEAKEIMDLLDHELALASSSSSTSTSEVVYDDLEVDLAAILNDVTQLKRLEDEAQAVMDGIKASAFKTVAAAAGGGGGEVVNVAGDALSLFAESLQVNITEEVLAQPHVKADLQAILAESALELSQQVHGLAVQQEALLEQLLTSPPPPPTTTTTTPEVLAFEKEKQEELDELLARQQVMQKDYLQSRETLKASTDRLLQVMKEVTTEADVLTSLALFPVRQWQEKVAFVVGLALLLKSFFDLGQQGWEQVGGQMVVALACFQYYGLLGAIGRTVLPKKKK